MYSSSNSGLVTGTQAGQQAYVGGLAGHTYNGAIIDLSTNTGKVVSPGERVGGITGGETSQSTVRRCGNTGEVSGTGSAMRVGGISGLISSRECYRILLVNRRGIRQYYSWWTSGKPAVQLVL